MDLHMRQMKLDEFEYWDISQVYDWFDLILYGVDYAGFYWTLDTHLLGWDWVFEEDEVSHYTEFFS